MCEALINRNTSTAKPVQDDDTFASMAKNGHGWFNVLESW